MVLFSLAPIARLKVKLLTLHPCQVRLVENSHYIAGRYEVSQHGRLYIISLARLRDNVRHVSISCLVKALSTGRYVWLTTLFCELPLFCAGAVYPPFAVLYLAS